MDTEFMDTQQMETSTKATGPMINKTVSFQIILGQGTYKFVNGSLYIGNFKNGQPHGEGTLEYNVFESDDIKYYKGNW